MFSDPLFWAAALPAVFLVGLSKGGLGGSMGMVGVPLMALAMSPLKAAAILLPILVVMDMVALWSWRGVRDGRTLAVMLPGSLVGIGIGWFMAAWVTEELIRLTVGVLAVLFVGRWVWQRLRHGRAPSHERQPVKGVFWATVAGFTSFVAHLGGPPYQIYTVPLGLDPKVYAGTSAIFFAVTNAVKLIPYFALGQFDTSNLAASAVLMPVAPVATLAGAWLVRRMKPDVFYPITYATVALIGIKLLWDGIAELL